MSKPGWVAGDELGHELSLRVVLFHEAVARRLGLTATEHKLLDMIGREEGITPGGLSRASGLSNAAITKVVDRLVATDYVRRDANPRDRRSVRLVRAGGYLAAMAEAYAGLSGRIAEGLTGFDEAEQQAVHRWLLLTIEALRVETVKLEARE